MGTTTRAVTPTLFVGGHPRVPHIPVESAVEAVAVIEHGDVARVPSFAVAADTLRLLGFQPRLIADRLFFARTGKVLYAV